MQWPGRFYSIRRGEGCPICLEGRPDENHDGVRFYAGEVSDAYLRRTGIQRGLTIVPWRGRHVSELTELTAEEAARYWQELLTVGRALEEVLQPVKLNYNLLGNAVPHLHTHIVPRYGDDPRPGWPFPFPEKEPRDMPEKMLLADVEALRAAAER
jgi:diadenosine tetraphosphate (Ap4A) HIT family hydrolase